MGDDGPSDTFILGGIVEETREFIRQHFWEDEWRRRMFQQEARQTEILENQFGSGGSGPPLVGGGGGDAPTPAEILGAATADSYTEVQTRGDYTPDDVTVTNEDTVELSPGEEADILRVPVSVGTVWTEIGTTSHTHTLYQYKVDGEAVFDNPLFQPLGVPNNMKEFPVPIKVDDTLVVTVSREDSASGAAEYFSKASLYESADTEA